MLIKAYIDCLIFGLIIFLIVQGIKKIVKAGSVGAKSLMLDKAPRSVISIYNGYHFTIPQTLMSSNNHYFTQQNDYSIRIAHYDYSDNTQASQILDYLQSLCINTTDIKDSSAIQSYIVNGFNALSREVKSKKNKWTFIVYDCKDCYITLSFKAYNSSFDSLTQQIIHSFGK